MENETIYCPKCMSGMERLGFIRYVCYICKKYWIISPDGFVSDKKLAEIHKGEPQDVE